MTDVINIGKLKFEKYLNHKDLLAEPVLEHLSKPEYSQYINQVFVSEIDPGFADTAEFCNFYDIGLDISANTIVIEAKRAGNIWHCACNILATTRADINKIIRKHINAKTASFASMDFAVSKTKMEHGGIGIIGMPKDWPILIDSKVLDHEYVIIGSGIRGSKIAITPNALIKITYATVIENMGIEIV